MIAPLSVVVALAALPSLETVKLVGSRLSFVPPDPSFAGVVKAVLAGLVSVSCLLVAPALTVRTWLVELYCAVV